MPGWTRLSTGYRFRSMQQATQRFAPSSSTQYISEKST
jgi:hypothetical protein